MSASCPGASFAPRPSADRPAENTLAGERPARDQAISLRMRLAQPGQERLLLLLLSPESPHLPARERDLLGICRVGLRRLGIGLGFGGGAVFRRRRALFGGRRRRRLWRGLGGNRLRLHASLRLLDREAERNRRQPLASWRRIERHQMQRPRPKRCTRREPMAPSLASRRFVPRAASGSGSSC